MTDPALVARKLEVLRDHVARIERRLPGSAEALRTDEDRLDAICMSVLVAVQETVDLAFHLASDSGWGTAATYAEGFAKLAQHGVIPAELARDLSGAARLRNRIAHGYASVDVDALFADLPGGVAAFRAFAERIAAHVQSSSS
jgi:uncharacterized protein YutE (UPF0331/DUF86 family)